MPKETPETIKHKAFPTYLLWKSLPSLLLANLDEAKRMGIKDEQIISLLGVENQTAFAARFKVSQITLSFWNKHIDKKGLLKDQRMVWMKKLTSNVVMALYREAIKEGDASRVKLFMQMVEGFVETQKVVDPAALALSDSIKLLAEKR